MPAKKIAEIVVVKTMGLPRALYSKGISGNLQGNQGISGNLQQNMNRPAKKIAEIVVVKTMGLPRGSLQQGNLREFTGESGNLREFTAKYESI